MNSTSAATHPFTVLSDFRGALAGSTRHRTLLAAQRAARKTVREGFATAAAVYGEDGNGNAKMLDQIGG